jgi:ArsR family transcriptional regulator, cadmium/lead-responsive transcriptional repressor
MLIDANSQSLVLQAKLFRGFGDPCRLAILSALCNGPLTVSEIVTQTRHTQPNISNHLGCLRDCGLVTAKQHWRHVTYRLSDPRVAELLKLAEELLAEVARGVYECARYEAAPGREQ